MRYFQAQDTFVAEMPDGTERQVTKGEPLPETHELVQRDLAAAKKDPGRTALFRLLDSGEPEPVLKARAASRAKAAG